MNVHCYWRGADFSLPELLCKKINVPKCSRLLVGPHITPVTATVEPTDVCSWNTLRDHVIVTAGLKQKYPVGRN